MCIVCARICIKVVLNQIRHDVMILSSLFFYRRVGIMGDLNAKELYSHFAKRKELIRETAQCILKDCHSKIHMAAGLGELYCLFEVPRYVFGRPLYDVEKMTKIIVKELSKTDLTI